MTVMRTIPIVAAAILCASAAGAATLSVESDKLTYNVGETITLTVHGDDEGATALSVFGRLLYNGALIDNGTQSQKTLIGTGTLVGGGPHAWTKQFLGAGDTNAAGPGSYSDAFNQIITSNGDTADNLPADNPFATVTLIAAAVGIVDVEWDTTTPETELHFFGLTDAPGTSFTIVPEPATAALLGLGLVALAKRRARRPLEAR
jgi:PEP-CTERM motif